ncbi:MAG TPA: 4-(cytidine 5'-diphospho)-2-C-methyl-D-erythritol kinase [Candidatus Competibacteraceae bacterium]|nr:4-(cytidine 5'-diphospho)-2-C-methyl-D-erythritol kinase [Candidatus Competibacteraceae bacterium]MCP5132257.1 4-(cytidine 5'-diphospho)-2-C-methyl-D-erythritol kinase [Gammaproteobacteria bacterium]HPF59216.1 4-(cytidine 5'-diphospho)-2-C-methyl-D-erythritol kinase [Candidatus Competibacteraceae bacterium]HRY17649.1 4-(cytidine 5'-diphospho)-2-C-methyl-D-erythritol kinase [Candidatus Competibacteraceae bacterium]
MPDMAAWPAPAKLNLMLRIIGRRQDGYHLLQTVFQFLDHSDWLRFDLREDGVIERKGEVAGVAPDADLTVRAARLLQQITGTRRGATVHIAKQLPMGGGLGGGSSDAATVLVALNQYWETGLTLAELAELGLQLGADVPVFVHGQAAWAEGVGEQLTPIALDEPWFTVLIPACPVATGAVFSDPELTRNSPLITIADFAKGVGGNDCAAVVYRRYPEVAAAAGWLAQHGAAYLTGTGACVFAAFPEAATARRVLNQLPPGWAGFIAQGRNHSPLHERLAREC